ncbi:MAG: AbrB/MazE/SpoVT family DNA-binding domain-containing protein, partial [Arcobacteraceae bacterium]|nr:AbrB/MazE/SpoVT family DNA-binding domain-containing protein [Arcobacteraceae bacterium]
SAKISKWGNSQGLRMPKDIMEKLHLHIGDDVELKIENDKVIIEPIKKEKKKYNIDELISKMPKIMLLKKSLKPTWAMKHGKRVYSTKRRFCYSYV